MKTEEKIVLPNNIKVEKYFDCINNAYVNYVRLKEIGMDPRIWFCITEKGHHAYIEVNGYVLNRGVTWGTDFYPELGPDDLGLKYMAGKAVDITERLELSVDNDTYWSVFGKNYRPPNLALKLIESTKNN